MIAISYNDTVDHVMQCDRDRPQEEQTVFLLKPLPHSVQRKFLNMIGSNMQVLEDFARAAESGDEVPDMASLPLGEMIDSIVPAGLAGWRNFKDAKGNEIVWKGNGKGCMESELLERFNLAALVELVGAIINRAFLSEEDRKN